jgi:hypothetical protein
MPIRNPFTRRPGSVVVQDENQRPDTAPGFEKVDTVGSKSRPVLSIRSQGRDNGEYKMSGMSQNPCRLSSLVVFPLSWRGTSHEAAHSAFRHKTSGIWLILDFFNSCQRQWRLSSCTFIFNQCVKRQSPQLTVAKPSPTEEKGQWPRKYLSTRNSTDTRSSLGDIEHFSISRESFDSYRRSFDITARSPITNNDFPSRQSLDSARLPRIPRSAVERSFEQPPTAEERFEDVGLDDHKYQQQQQPAQQAQPQKRGFFSKFSDSRDKDPSSNPSVSRFLMHGRKRAQSGQGSELTPMDNGPPKVTISSEGQEMH